MTYRFYRVFYTGKKFYIIFIFFYTFTFGQKVYFVKFSESIPVDLIEKAFTAKNVINLPSNRSSVSNESLQYRNLGNKYKISDPHLSHIYVISLPYELTLSQFQESLNPELRLEYLEASHTYKIESSANDSLLSQQWALKKIDAFGTVNKISSFLNRTTNAIRLVF